MRWLGCTTVIGLMLALVGASPAAQPIGRLAPDLSLTLLDGRAISLKEFRGKPVVVNFWHSG